MHVGAHNLREKFAYLVNELILEIDKLVPDQKPSQPPKVYTPVKDWIDGGTTQIGADTETAPKKTKVKTAKEQAEDHAKMIADLLYQGENLTWDQAHMLLCEGHHVRRKSWTMPSIFQWGYFGIARYKNASGFYQMTLYAGTLAADVCNLIWSPSAEERAAKDWMVHEF